MVSFMPRPLYVQWKGPFYPLDRSLGGPQSWSGRGDEEKNSQPLTPLIQSLAQRCTAELFRLLLSDHYQYEVQYEWNMQNIYYI
jgi:hypothetical protein